MTKITTVSIHPTDASPAQGLKGILGTLALTGCDIIAGPNGAGKTTRGPLAIAAAIEGLAGVPTDPRRPYIGVPPAGTSVTLTLDSGAHLTRPLDAMRGRRKNEADEEARLLIGIPPTAWDLRDFASSTPGERSRIIDAVARAGGALDAWTIEGAQARVAEISMADMGPLQAALPTATDAATWLASAIPWAETQAAKVRASVRDVEGATRAASAAIGPEPGGPSLDTLRAEAATLDPGALERHNLTGSRLRAKLSQCPCVDPGPRPPGVLAELRAEVAAAGDGSALRAHEAEGARLRDRVERLSGVPDVPHPGEQPDTAAAQAAFDAADETLKEAERAYRAKQSQLTDAERLSTDCIGRAEAIGGTDACCVHCGQSDPLGKQPIRTKLLHEAAEHTAAADGFRRELRALQESGAAARLAYGEARATLGTIRQARARWSDDMQRHASAAQRMGQLEQARGDLELWESRPTPAGASPRADELRALEAWHEANSSAVVANARHSDARADLAEWEAMDPPADVSVRAAELATAIREREAWESRRDASGRAAQKMMDTREALADAKALVAGCRQARDEMAAAAYGPIHEAASGLLSDAPTGIPAPYFTAPDDYGAWVKGERVPYPALSESEQRITAAAMVYALASVSKCPVRLVLLDGMEVVERDHRGPLVRALGQAVADGRVDNVVMTMAASPDEDLEYLEGATVHRLSGGEYVWESVKDSSRVSHGEVTNG